MLSVIARARPRRPRSLAGLVVRPGSYAHGRRKFSLLTGHDSLVYPDGTEELLVPRGALLFNAVADEGEAEILDVFLKENAHKSKYLALYNDSGIAETDTMASITSEAETVATDGYDRQQITSGQWGSNALDSGDYQSTAAEKTFGPNTGAAWTLTHVGLVTVSTGTAGLFLAYVATSTGTVSTSVAYKYTLTWKNQ